MIIFKILFILIKKQIIKHAKRKDTKHTNPRIVKSKNNRSMIQSNCAICGNKKSRFIKEQQAKGLLSNLGIKTPLNKVSLLNILF